MRIATRKSPLAMWQAEHIKQRLEALHTGLQVDILGMSTQGDRWLQTSLSKVGGKGLFVKELEHALLNNEADIAVHSMKDVPMDFPEGLCLGAICEREDPSDAFVSSKYKTLADMPEGSVVGTSSLRRRAQLAHFYPQLNIKDVRGNVNTRLKKMDDGEFDALILASAGLKRLGFESRLNHSLDKEWSLPAVGQGALGIELRENDTQTMQLIAPLIHEQTQHCVLAERAMNEKLHGGCQVPVAAFAEIVDGQIHMRGRVAQTDGSIILNAQAIGAPEQAQALGEQVAQELIDQGAQAILSSLKI